MPGLHLPERQLGIGHLEISAREKELVNEVLSSNRLSYGTFSKRFEQEFARLHGAKYGTIANSGTSSLQVALAALAERGGWRPGDEVIVPAITFIATPNVCLMLGFKPVFVDVDPKTYNINPALINQRITDRTRAIIPVHMFGLPADMEPILEVAKRRDLRVLEDSCETMFVSTYGRPVGSHGDIACFSTYVAHFLVTGVGGLSVTNDRELAVITRSLCNHGRDSIYLSIDDDAGKTGEELSTVMRARFSFVRLGYSYRLTEVEAALGCAQLEVKDEILEARQKNARYLIKGLRPLEDAGYVQLPSIPDYAEHAFMLFPVVVRKGKGVREELTLFLEERRIETRPMMPVINQPIYVERYGNLEPEYPVAADINSNGFYIGCHQGLDESALDYIIESFGAFFAYEGDPSL